jgi:uncharacterized protein
LLEKAVLRAVLDTNIFISSLLNKTGAPARLLDLWRDGQYLLLSSPPIIKEIKTVLELPRIKTKYCLSDLDIQKLINLLEMDAIVVPGIMDVGNAIPEDPSDSIFLSCALEGSADVIVSGDRHLLNLKNFKGIPVIPVNEFIDLLKPD